MEASNWNQKKHPAYIFKEAYYTGGDFYIVLYENIYGYQISQICLPTQYTIDDLKQMIDELGYTPIEVQSNPTKSLLHLDTMDVATSANLEDFKVTLDNIERLQPAVLDDYSSGDCVTELYPGFLIYEISHYAVKVPIKRTYSSGDVNWSYEYLINPNFTLNRQTLDTINKLYQKNFSIDTEGLKGNVLFSREVYNFFRREFFFASVNVKAIANAIRIRELENSWTTEYYSIYHNSRIAKTDTIETEGFEYNGMWNEVTFKEYVELIGEDIEYIQSLAFKTEEKKAYIESHESQAAYLPCILYLQAMSKNVDTVFDDYTKYEIKRQLARKNLYFLHIAFAFSNLESTVNFLKNTGCCLTESYYTALSFKNVQWVNGDKVESVILKKHRKRNKK